MSAFCLPPCFSGYMDPSLFAFFMKAFLEVWDSTFPYDCAKVSFLLSSLGDKAQSLLARDEILDDSISLLVTLMYFFGGTCASTTFLEVKQRDKAL